MQTTIRGLSSLLPTCVSLRVVGFASYRRGGGVGEPLWSRGAYPVNVESPA